MNDPTLSIFWSYLTNPYTVGFMVFAIAFLSGGVFVSAWIITGQYPEWLESVAARLRTLGGTGAVRRDLRDRARSLFRRSRNDEASNQSRKD
jgi:hypothetical protein